MTSTETCTTVSERLTPYGDGPCPNCGDGRLLDAVYPNRQDAQGRTVKGRRYIACFECGWRVHPDTMGLFTDWRYVGFAEGLPERCGDGHIGAWAIRKVAGRTDAICLGFDTESKQTCRNRVSVGQRQGFLNGKAQWPRNHTKAAVLVALWRVPGGRGVGELKDALEGQRIYLSRGQIRGVINRCRSGVAPYVERGALPEALVPSGAGFRYRLTPRGAQWCKVAQMKGLIGNDRERANE